MKWLNQKRDDFKVVAIPLPDSGPCLRGMSAQPPASPAAIEQRMYLNRIPFPADCIEDLGIVETPIEMTSGSRFTRRERVFIVAGGDVVRYSVRVRNVNK